MLVLSRSIRQPRIRITIPDLDRSATIFVDVLEIRGNQVRLAVTAPPTITVDREEIWQRKAQVEQQQQEDQAA